MLKNKLTVLFALAICLFSLSGCSTLSQVSGSAFMEQAKHIGALESAQSTTYIGATTSRVYLEHWTASVLSSKGTTTVIWTPLSELPPSVVSKIKEGVNPWATQGEQLVPTEFSGKWVPESESCHSPLSLEVTPKEITFINKNEKQAFSNIKPCFSCEGGAQYSGIVVWLTTTDINESPFTIYFNAKEVKNSALVEITSNELNAKFPLNKVELKKCTH
jgi:hypothetical protein